MGEVVPTNENPEVQQSADLMSLVNALGEQDFYDRAKYEGDMAQEIVDVFSSFQPEQRSTMYTLWRSTAMVDGLGALADHEILLLGFAPRDGGATEAAKALGEPFSYQWYQNNVAFESDEDGTEGYGGPLKRLMEADPELSSRPEDLLRIMDLDAQSRAVREPTEIESVTDTLGRYATNTFGAIAAGTTLLAGTAMATATGVGVLQGGAAVAASPAGVATIAAVSPWIKKLWSAASVPVKATTSATGRAVLGTEGGAWQSTKAALQYVQLRTDQTISQFASKLAPAAANVPLAGPALSRSVARVGAYGTPRGSWRLLAAGGVLTSQVVDGLANPEAVTKAWSDDDTTRDDEAGGTNTAGVDAMVARTTRTGMDRYEQIEDGFNMMETEIDETVQLANARTAEATRISQLVTYRTQTVDRLGRTRDGGEGQIAESPAAPEVTDQDIGDVLNGTATIDDFDLGGDPEIIMAEAAMSMFPGAHWYDEEVDGSTADVAAAGGVVYEDVRSLDEFGKPRKIVLPQTAAVGGAGEAYEYQYTKLQESMGSEPVDELIGVPEGYRARTYQPISDRFGGGTMLPDTPGTVPREMDRYEADFITRVQGTSGAYEESRTVTANYRESDIYDQMANMSPVQIFKFQGLMRTAGLYQGSSPSMPGQFTPEDAALIEQTMWIANVNGDTFWQAADSMAKAAPPKATQPTSTSSASVRAPFSVPTSLRSIPGEKTIAEEVKARFEQKLGRQATSEELTGIANELTGYYTQSNKEQIALYMAAYDGDNQGLLTGAQMQRIEEPGAATSFDIADKWANEIDLTKRRETNSESFSRMLSATMGNRPSVGNLTAAGGVTEIGRQ